MSKIAKWIPTVLGAKAFSPLDVTGLQQWLKADAGTYQDAAKTTAAASDADPVGGWADQSGNGKDATQSTDDSYRPTLQTNERNGLPLIRWDGSNDVLAHTAIALTNYTIYIAYKATDLSAGLAYILGGTGMGFYGGGVAGGGRRAASMATA